MDAQINRQSAGASNAAGLPNTSRPLKGVPMHIYTDVQTKSSGKYSYKMNVDPKSRVGKFKKLNMFCRDKTFKTKRRAPFEYPCEQCLHIGYTRTYRVQVCWINELVSYTILFIVFEIASQKTADRMYVQFGCYACALYFLILLLHNLKKQCKSWMCPTTLVNHYCANCGSPIANYKDPEDCCCGIGHYCNRYHTVEDDYEDDGLIFQKDQIVSARKN